MPSVPEDWKRYPYQERFSHRFRTYLDADGRLDLPVLAGSWLEELFYIGLQKVDPSSGAPPKEPSTSSHPRTDSPLEDIYPLRLEDSREVLWIRPNGLRMPWGYRRTEVLSTPLKTDTAILGAITALEAEEVEAERLEDSRIDHVIDVWKGWSERTTGPPELTEEESKDFSKVVDKIDEHGAEKDEPFGLRYDHPNSVIEYVISLLRHYRPNFDSLPREEQRGLVKGGCKRVTRYLKATRELSAFLEYGVSNTDLRSKVEDAERDIHAAELQDVQELSSLKLGEELGVAAPPSDLVKRTNSTANAMAKRGRKLLQSSLGEKGWRAWVEAKKVERNRFLSLSEKVQALVEFEENTGTSIEDMYIGQYERDTKE
jgi:hypothetical protein